MTSRGMWFAGCTLAMAIVSALYWCWKSALPPVEVGWISDVVVVANGDPVADTLSLKDHVLFDVSFMATSDRIDTARWEGNILFGQGAFERTGPNAPGLLTLRWYAPGKGRALSLGTYRNGKPASIPPFAPDDGRIHFLASKSASTAKSWQDPSPPQVGPAILEFTLYPEPGPPVTGAMQRDWGPSHLVFRKLINVTEIEQ